MSAVNVLDYYEPEALAAASVVIAGHGVPYPPMPAPPYRMTESGAWQFHQASINPAIGAERRPVAT